MGSNSSKKLIQRIIKRAFDSLVAFVVMLIFSPIIGAALFLVWLHDKHSPIYKAPRIGKQGKPFTMYKVRTMVIGADKSGVDSTSSDDVRITRVGQVIRRYKVDELLQLVNVLRGEMSVVGPRPNIASEVALYSQQEIRLLSVRPGITDFSSVVFSDLGEILAGAENPNLAYNQLVRPWKSRLGLVYVDQNSFEVDIMLCVATVLSLVSRPLALGIVSGLLRRVGGSNELIRVSQRVDPLVPAPPPGFQEIVTRR